MSIEIANESGVEVDSDAIQSVARHALDEMGVNPLAELSILLVEAEYMAELNHRWMDGDGPTDVLAFPMDEQVPDEEPYILGDIVICPDVAKEQAPDKVSDEVDLLLVHGFLHLMGYDHVKPADARSMRHRERKILAEFHREER